MCNVVEAPKTIAEHGENVFEPQKQTKTRNIYHMLRNAAKGKGSGLVGFAGVCGLEPKMFISCRQISLATTETGDRKEIQSSHLTRNFQQITFNLI